MTTPIRSTFARHCACLFALVAATAWASTRATPALPLSPSDDHAVRAESAHGERGPETPNIVLILADDLGAETVGAYGGESYHTPRLDRMALDGVRFERGHAQTVAARSPVQLLTGRHDWAAAARSGVAGSGGKTLAHVLGSAGYHTAVIGAWPLIASDSGESAGVSPGAAGFDDYVLWRPEAEERYSRYWGPQIDHAGDLRQYDATVFGPDVLNEAALAFIAANRARPFFLYYPLLLPHKPFVTTPDMRNEDADDQARFGAMVAYLDTLVGRVLDQLDALGLADDTVVFFIGSGGTDRDIVSRYRGTDVRGAKGDTITAATRVPYIAWGPGRVRDGKVSDSLVDLTDILPTLAALAGVELGRELPVDGFSLLPVLRGEGELSRANLFIDHTPDWTEGRPARYAFDRRYKLYDQGGFYDMTSDPLERRPQRPDSLDPEELQAYRALQARLRSMPGELPPRGPQVATVAVVLVGMALVVVAAILTGVTRLLRRLRQY